MKRGGGLYGCAVPRTYANLKPGLMHTSQIATHHGMFNPTMLHKAD